jgi:hypothetical protein
MRLSNVASEYPKRAAHFLMRGSLGRMCCELNASPLQGGVAAIGPTTPLNVARLLLVKNDDAMDCVASGSHAGVRPAVIGAHRQRRTKGGHQRPNRKNWCKTGVKVNLLLVKRAPLKAGARSRTRCQQDAFFIFGI